MGEHLHPSSLCFLLHGTLFVCVWIPLLLQLFFALSRCSSHMMAPDFLDMCVYTLKAEERERESLVCLMY